MTFFQCIYFFCYFATKSVCGFSDFTSCFFYFFSCCCCVLRQINILYLADTKLFSTYSQTSLQKTFSFSKNILLLFTSSFEILCVSVDIFCIDHWDLEIDILCIDIHKWHFLKELTHSIKRVINRICQFLDVLLFSSIISHNRSRSFTDSFVFVFFSSECFVFLYLCLAEWICLVSFEIFYLSLSFLSIKDIIKSLSKLAQIWKCYSHCHRCEIIHDVFCLFIYPISDNTLHESSYFLSENICCTSFYTSLKSLSCF